MKKIITLILLISFINAGVLTYTNVNRYPTQYYILKKVEKKEKISETICYLMGIPLLGTLITGIIYSITHPVKRI